VNSAVVDPFDWDDVLSLPAVWFRDNCACTECRDPRNQQKLLRISDLPEELSISDVERLDDKIVITFQPDGHRSVFDRQWFTVENHWRVGDGRSERSKILWVADDLKPTTQHCDWSTYCGDSAARLEVLRGIEQLGFAIIHGTPTDERTVLRVARSFGFVRETNYGEIFDVRVEAKPSNLAFTGAAISPHTDNPYRDPVPTMQLLHCLSNDVVGGESGFVDGFRAAAILRDHHPRFFDVLTSTPVTFTWGDESNVLIAVRPIIELDPLGQVRGIRFNNRSMQSLRLDAARLAGFFESYRCFADILERPDLLTTFRLEAGDCVIFDNTRILHARTAFVELSEGRRHLQGCYADLDGLASTVTVLERAMAHDS
jgi:gamma-butyrobetaine dioxygenase